MVLKEIYITRHGSREDWVNPNPSLPTNLLNDTSLSKEGRAQAKELAAFLKHKSIDRIYTSPFYRVIETVYPLVEECDTPLYIDYAMVECKWYGLGHGLYLPYARIAKLKELFPKLNLERHISSIPVPTEAESTRDCHLRVKNGLNKLLNTLDSDKEAPHTILLSGHAATAICAVRAILNDPFYPVRSGTCSLSHFIRQSDNTWKLVSNGDSSHLSKGEQDLWMFSDDDKK